MSKTNLGRKGLTWLPYPESEFIEGSRGRNLKAGTEAEAAEGHCLLNCFSWLAQPAFLSLRTIFPESTQPTTDWDLPRLTNQGKVPRVNLQGPLSQSSFPVSNDSSFLQVDKRLSRTGGNQWHSPSTEEPGSHRIMQRIFTDQQYYTCIYRRKVCSFSETLPKK